jgi:hypothetical protein
LKEASETWEYSFLNGSNTISVKGTESTVTYVKGEDPKESTEPEESTDPETSAQPTTDMAALKIEKYYSTVDGTKLPTEKVFSSLSEVASYSAGDLLYTIKVTNTSNVTYTTKNAEIIDYLPDGMQGKYTNTPNQQLAWGVGDFSKVVSDVDLAKTAEDDVSYDDTTFYNYSIVNADANADPKTTNINIKNNLYDANVIKLKMQNSGSTDGSFTLEPNQSLDLVIVVQLSEEIYNKIAAQNSKDGDFDFDPMEFTNTAYFKGDTTFKNKYGRETTTIADSETVRVHAKSIHPGIKKTAYGSMQLSNNKFVQGPQGATVGSSLIWKLRVDNGTGKSTATSDNESMSDYTLTDTLPIGYKYGSPTGDMPYTNSKGLTYPTDLWETKFQSGQAVIVDDSGNIKRTVDVPTPEITGDDEHGYVVKWVFTDTTKVTADGTEEDVIYTLAPGEHLEFTILTSPINDLYRSGVYYNKAELTVGDKIYEDSVQAGTYEDNSITDGDSFSMNTVLTSSEITVTTDAGTASGNEANNNIATGTSNETVHYTMSVTNESNLYSIENLSFINRIPYVGDSGVIVSGQRGSEYNVILPDNLNLTVTMVYTDEQGNKRTKVLDGDNVVITTYTADTDKSFTEVSDDWDIDYSDGWSEGHDSSTKLIRIQLAGVDVPAGATVYVSYDAQLPTADSISNTTAWNSFAYHYDSAAAKAYNMAAEPEAVGVKLPATDNGVGTIKIKKVWASENTEPKTFWFTIYDAPYTEGAEPVENGGPKSITLTAGGGTAKPVNAELTFDNLNYFTIAKEKSFYIYETDKDGVPIAQSSDLGYNMFTGFYRTDKGDNYNLESVTSTSGSVELGSKSKIVFVGSGSTASLKKGLSAAKKSNSAIFSNIDTTVVETTPTPTPIVSVSGAYYADVATSFTQAKAQDDHLTTGVRDADGNHTTREDNEDATRDHVYYSYDSDKQVNISDGWGGDQGHTVATGFMANIKGTAAGQVIDNVQWDIYSKPATNGNSVFMKLTSDEREAMVDSLSGFGYTLEETAHYNDDSTENSHGSAIYEIIQKTYDDNESVDMNSVENAVQNDTPTADENDGVRFTDDSEENDVAMSDDSENGFDVVFDNAEQDESGLWIMDDDVYAELHEAVDQKTLHWRITDNIPQITLGKGTVVNVGIILDQIYDKNAVGVLSIGATATPSAIITDSTDKNYLAADNGEQVKVPNVNQTGEFAKKTHKLSALKTLSAGDKIDFSNAKTCFDADDYDTDGKFSGTVLNNDQNVMICSDSSNNKTTVDIVSGYVRVTGYNSTPDANNNIIPSVAIKVTSGTKLRITASSGNDDKVRALDIITAAGNRVMNSDDIKKSDSSSHVTGYTYTNDSGESVDCIAPKAEISGIWFGNTDETHDVTISEDGIVYIVSPNSNVNIKSIEVVSVGETGE